MNGTVRRHSGGGWIADVTINGTRRTARAPNKKRAESLRKQLVRELLDRPVVLSEGCSVAEARKLSLKVRWANTSYERTAAIYSRSAVEWFGDRQLGSITTPEIEAWRQALLKQGNRPATVNRKVSALRAMFSDAVLHGRIQHRPEFPKQLTTRNARDRIVTAEEAAAFVRYWRAIGQEAAGDLLTFLLETGCRWGEAERLTGRDVKGGRVTFWETKNRSARTIPLTRRAQDALRPHLPAVPTHRVFPYRYQQFKDLWNRAKAHAGIDDPALVIHSCRHTCATRLAEAGVPLHQLQAWGGWRTMAACQRYLHHSTDALKGCVAALEQA